MANNALVSRVSEPYAYALLDFANSNMVFDVVTSDVTDLLTLFNEVPELPRYLANPVVSNDKKKALLKTVLGSLLNPYTLKFLLFLVERRRIAFFNAIGEKFLEIAYRLSDVVIVNVRSFIPLTYKQESELILQLKELRNAKEVQLVREVDKTLLGGLVIQIGSELIDMSLKGKLRQISSHLGASLVV